MAVALSGLRPFFLSLVLLAALPGCTTTGSSFNASTLYLLVPGETTLEQAGAILQSAPVAVYRQTDGAAMARWAQKASFVPDAVYFNRELWLSFDTQGHYVGVVKSINVPQAHAHP